MNAPPLRPTPPPRRHWSDSATAVNELAGQYVLGTLQGAARRRFETVMALRPDVAERVADWEGRLHRMAGSLPPVAPSPALWDTLARRAGVAVAPLVAPVVASVAAPAVAPVAAPVVAPVVAPAVAPVRAPAPSRRPAPPSLWQRIGNGLHALLAPVPAGALAFGLLAGLVIPQVVGIFNAPSAADTELPESYVGVLATPAGKPGLIVASRRHGRVVDLKQVSPAVVPAGQTLFLWIIDAKGVATPVGAVPSGPFVQAQLADTAENVFKTAVELGVTLEAQGSTPTAPGGAWVYRGLCGKVWRVAPPAPAPAASR